jgi:hypothetical protein
MVMLWTSSHAVYEKEFQGDPYLALEVIVWAEAGVEYRNLGLPDFRGQVDYVLRLRIWQASSYLIGLMFPRAVCLRWVL